MNNDCSDGLGKAISNNDGGDIGTFYKEVLSNHYKLDYPLSTSFNFIFYKKYFIVGGPTTNGGGLDRGDLDRVTTRGNGDGKSSPHDFKTLSLSPNKDMVLAIRKKQSRSKDIIIFFIFLGKIVFTLLQIF